MLQRLPPPDQMEFTWNTQFCCLVSDEGTAVTDYLVQTLQAQGWKVVVLRFPFTLVQPSTTLPSNVGCITLVDLSEAHLQQQLQVVHQTYGAIAAFIHLHPSAESEAIARTILKQIFLIAKHLKKSLNQVAEQSRSYFVTVVRLDGELGVSQRMQTNPINGGLFGLTKTMNLECPQVFCRALDISPEVQPEKVARMIVNELCDANSRVVDVGYGQQGRQTLICQPKALLTTNNVFHPTITQQAVFLVSGGGRGITAKCVVRLAKVFHCRFILLGRSVLYPEPEYLQGWEDEIELKQRIVEHLAAHGERPTPSNVQSMLQAIVQRREIRSTLAQVEAAGGQAIYLSADVGSDRQIDAKIAEAEQTLGKVTGIIHGAGSLADKLIEQKTEQDFETVYIPKVEGLKTLLNCVSKESLKHLVLFTSVAGFYGNIGQADYAIANEILNRFAYQFKRHHTQCHVTAVNWGPWDGGMVTPALKQRFRQRGIEVIPVQVGTQMLAEELAWGNPDTIQIVVGSRLQVHHDDLSNPALV